MKFKLTLIFFLFAVNLLAETHPIKSLNTGNKWYFVECGWMHGSGNYTITYYLKSAKDTLINNTIFHKIEKCADKSPGAQYNPDLRPYFEHVDTSKVISFFPYLDSLREEIVYDFSLEVGDTIFNDPMLNDQNDYWRFFTMKAKGDTVLFGEELSFIEIVSSSDYIISYGKAEVLIAEKIGVIKIDATSGGFCYIAQLSGAFIDGKVFGDTTKTSVNENTIEKVANFNLSQNHPNPFNSTTEIRYSLPQRMELYHIIIKIYNIQGRLVNILVDQSQSAGMHAVKWNGTDWNNHAVSSGIYFYTLQAGEYRVMKKMLLLE